MRRYAKQDREDQYASRRDYQQISQTSGLRLSGKSPLKIVRLSAQLTAESPETIAGFGGFILTPKSAQATLRIHLGGTILKRSIHTGPSWSRIGLGFLVSQPTQIVAELEFATAPDFIDVWGLTIGLSHFPSGTTRKTTHLADLNVSHLLPETLYLDHSANIGGTLSGAKAKSGGARIDLKKCSYCGRQLPVGPGAAGRLSFHKHNAKISGHQNECRACKKWRINDSFNPLRTVDQLNESSIITRERRLLLREPEILQQIKEREGRGLKSIVWERFGRSCFYCEKPLALKEVELDHTRPLAYLWPIDEYATCLCAEHNNHKKDKFPVDFYTPAQLKRLSSITGLPLSELTARTVCEPQLQRISGDIVAFAKQCDPRAFNAIARKVREIRPDVDLWADLSAADMALFRQVESAAAERPESITPKLVESEIDEMLNTLEE